MILRRHFPAAGTAVALLLGWGIRGLLAADEFSLVTSTFSPASSAAGGAFELTLQPLLGVAMVERLSGGQFSLDPVPVPPTATASASTPSITLDRLPDGTLRIAWGDQAAGWSLESSADLRQWQTEGNTLAGAGSRNAAAASTTRFYRLRR